MWIIEDYFRSAYDRPMPFYKEDLEKLDATEWEKCFEAEVQVTEGCRLVLVLDVLLKKFGFNEAQKAIVAYVANSKSQPDTEDLLEYMSREHDISMPDLLSARPDSLTGPVGVFSLYITFFAVLDDGNKMISPQSLSSYIVLMPDIHIPNDDEFGPFIAWILNGYSQWIFEYTLYVPPYNPVPEFYGLVRDIWLDSLKIYLNVDSHSKATLLMNSFWHAELESDLFQPSTHRISRGYLCMSSNNGSHTLDEICKQTSRIDPECEEYCKLIDNLTFDIKFKVRKVLSMGLDLPSPTMGTFQACQHPKKGTFGATKCWKKVLNNKGVCYSSIGDSKYLKCMWARKKKT